MECPVDGVRVMSGLETGVVGAALVVASIRSPDKVKNISQLTLSGRG